MTKGGRSLIPPSWPKRTRSSGVRPSPTGSSAGTVMEADILAKIETRQKARADRDFKRADEIRDELLEAGIVLEDTKDGVRWKRTGPPKS